jgi:hypothetical protein
MAPPPVHDEGDKNPHGWVRGDILQIAINGELVDAVYEEWSEKYGLPITRYQGVRQYRNAYIDGKKIPAGKPGSRQNVSNRRVSHAEAEQMAAAAVKKSRFDVNQRFQYIETLVDMVIKEKSKSVIISGSGGLGKTFTVLAKLKEAGLVDKADTDHECDAFCVDPDDPDSVCTIGDYVMVKGFSTPKGLYRVLYENRTKLIVFDDVDSVWENPTTLNLLKSALDSYDVRRISWLSEL